MKKGIVLLAASYPSRIFENDITIKSPGCFVLCQDLSINVATGSKNKESSVSLFFSRRQRSKVIARVTRKSLRTFSDNSRAYLALRGCDHAEDKYGSLRIYPPLQNMLTLVTYSEVTWQPADFAPGGRKTSGLQAGTTRNRGGRSHLPLVAYPISRSDANGHLMVFHNIKRNSYGK